MLHVLGKQCLQIWCKTLDSRQGLITVLRVMEQGVDPGGYKVGADLVLKSLRGSKQTRIDAWQKQSKGTADGRERGMSEIGAFTLRKGMEAVSDVPTMAGTLALTSGMLLCRRPPIQR